MIKKIREIPKTSIQKLNKTILSFEITNKAASRNSKKIAKFNGNLGAEIAAQNYSSLNYGP